MTYTLRKSMAGQEVVKKLTFFLNKCKYSAPPYTTQNKLTTDNASLIGANSTGVSLAVVQSGGSSWVASWNSYPTYPILFFKLKDEVIKVQVVSSTSVTILQRKLYGTAGGTISRFSGVEIVHEGYLDGSCYGYSQTCTTPGSYQTGLFKELTFSSSPLPSGAVYHGGLKFTDCNYQSAEVKPGETIGSRAKLSFKISDQHHNDYDISAYEDRRSESGTLFGKLLARNPYFNGRPIRYSVGLRDANSLAEPFWEHRNLIIDSINLNDDSFSGSALDPLILTEGKKAKIPLASPAQLTAAITSGSTSVVFGNAPAGYFGSSGNVIIRIDSELIQVTANGTTTMPIVARGFGRTAIKDHSVNATVQNCIRFINTHVIDCITYALQTWTSTPASFIDNYAAVKALIPSVIVSDYVLSSPVDVVDFINQCIFIGNLIFYFDDVTQKIVIKYIPEVSVTPIYINDSEHIKKDSVKKDLNYKEQYTRFNLSWAPFDLTKESEKTNYQISLTGANLGMESAAKIGEVNERKGMLLPMLNSSSQDYIIGASAVNRIISVADKPPEIFECELDAESIGETQGSKLELGSIVSIQSSENQNGAGIGQSILYQCVKIDGDPFRSYRVKFKRYQVIAPDSFDFVIPAGVYINYVLTDNYSPLGSGQKIIYVSPGAIFGSYNTTIAAFRTGTPPAGVTFKFIARWQIMGMGGHGGSWVTSGSPAASIGIDGGTAFEANCNCTIDNGAGIIWAGGGGGGGDYTQTFPNGGSFIYSPARGGGGGQGFGISLGGAYVNLTSPPDTPSTDGNERNGSQAGAGQSGNFGGEWGQPGRQGSASSLLPSPNNGLAGIAIKTNGFSVTIISGDNPLSIRGRKV